MLTKPDIVIVDDHRIFREGLKSIINSENFANVIGEASDGSEFLELLKRIKPDIVLMDINMPNMDGMEATKRALIVDPNLKIIAFTMFGNREYYDRMIDLGVKGFIMKSSGILEIEDAIREVMKGYQYFSLELHQINGVRLPKTDDRLKSAMFDLTGRESVILQMICQGCTTEEISNRLSLSPKTIKNHRSSLLRKTGCKNTPGLILFALKNKIAEV